MKTKEKTISASEFKAKCLKVLDHLGREGIVITKRGHPVARVTPVEPTGIGKYYGSMKGKIKAKGGIFSTGIKWNAES
jgi:prevent-host-death family protein